MATATPAQVRALIDAELAPAGEVIAVLAEPSVLSRAFAQAGLPAPTVIAPAR